MNNYFGIRESKSLINIEEKIELLKELSSRIVLSDELSIFREHSIYLCHIGEAIGYDRKEVFSFLRDLAKKTTFPNNILNYWIYKEGDKSFWDVSKALTEGNRKDLIDSKKAWLEYWIKELEKTVQKE